MNNEEQERIISEAKAFANEYLRPHAGEFEEKEGVPREIIKTMASKKYLGGSLPIEFGGLGLDPVYYGFLTEEIGKGCSSTRALLTVHTSLVGETLAKLGTREQQEKWLPAMTSGEKIACFALTEPDVGTDANSIKTSYTKSGQKYLINGRKKWTTFGHIADLFLVLAADNGSVTAFMLERGMKGITTTPMKGLLAGRAAYIAEIEFNKVEVPAENVICREGLGFNFVANNALHFGRYSIAWAGLAIAEAALEEMVTYARTRSQFGQKLYKFQLIEGMIGDAITSVRAGRALCLSAGEFRKQINDQAIIETTIAKYFTSKIAMEISRDAVQVHGGNGCYNAYPVERLFREAKILEIIEGTSQIQQRIIADYGLKRYYLPKKTQQRNNPDT